MWGALCYVLQTCRGACSAVLEGEACPLRARRKNSWAGRRNARKAKLDCGMVTYGRCRVPFWPSEAGVPGVPVQRLTSATADFGAHGDISLGLSPDRGLSACQHSAWLTRGNEAGNRRYNLGTAGTTGKAAQEIRQAQISTCCVIALHLSNSCSAGCAYRRLRLSAARPHSAKLMLRADCIVAMVGAICDNCDVAWDIAEAS